jgi:hypothetical protein
MDVTGVISELYSELQKIEEEIAWLERLDAGTTKDTGNSVTGWVWGPD